MARVTGDCEATILGMLDAPTSDDDEAFEVRPAGEFDFDLASPSKRAPRDLDAEVESLDLDFEIGDAATVAPAAPARSAKSDVWELDEATAKPASGPIALTLEIDGLSGELRRTVESLIGKVLELPTLRVRIKGRDLG